MKVSGVYLRRSLYDISANVNHGRGVKIACYFQLGSREGVKRHSDKRVTYAERRRDFVFVHSPRSSAKDEMNILIPCRASTRAYSQWSGNSAIIIFSSKLFHRPIGTSETLKKDLFN